MKKRNHPANVVDVSSRIMGLLGRRKVDPTTEAMRELKPHFDVSVLTEGLEQPDRLYLMPVPGESPLHGMHIQVMGRHTRKPGLTPDEQKRLIDVLERMLTK